MTEPKAVFGHVDYKEVLRNYVSAHAKERGYLAKLAEAAGCQRSFLSQVLHSHVHLTPDHAVGIAMFWNLTEIEREYFLELLHYARSGSALFRQTSERKLKRLRDQSENLKERLQRTTTLQEAEQIRFYSAWYSSAIHLLLTIQEFQSLRALAKRLNVSESLVTKCLHSLEAMGLAQKSGEKWIATNVDIHLSKESPAAWLHHSNWRTRALADAQLSGAGSVHYTSLYSLSRADFDQIKSTVLKMIEQTRNVAVASAEEDLACFILDWFWI
jgi:uncharacterized protein (TIGR02147 family)